MGFARKKTVSQVDEIDAEFDSSRGTQTRLVVANSVISVVSASALLSSGTGKSVPPRIFQGWPCAFEAFVICIIFSFTGSFSWLFIGNKPKFATFRRFYFIISMVFMASALSILACALFLDNFSLVSPGTRLWNPENFRFVFRN